MGSLSFLTPLAGLVAVAGLLPLAVHLRRERRGREVRRALGLAEPPFRGRSLLFALVAVPALMGIAASQPVVDRAEARQVRANAEILFVFDTTRSMYASRSASEPTRFDRARSIAREVRAAVPEVPAGVASLTDRTLPHLFPTIDGSTFAATVARAVSIERPPPGRYARLATDLNGLAAVARQGYFSAAATKRVLVVLTDGETEPIRAALPAALARARIRTVLVHAWAAGESIFLTSAPEPDYRPDPGSRAALARYASGLEGRLFGENEVEAIVPAVRAALGEGPTEPRSQRDLFALMPYATLAAVLPLALVLRRRNL